MATSFLYDVFEGKKGSSYAAIKTKLAVKGWSELALEGIYPGADFCWKSQWEKRVGFQRKTVMDFMGSWFDGRLQDQLYKLAKSVDICGLILDGLPWIDHKDGSLITQYGKIEHGRHPVSFFTFTHCMAEVIGEMPDGMKLQLIILPGGVSELVQWLSVVGPDRYDQPEFTGWERGLLPPRHQDPRIRALLGLPGMGIKNCEAALAHYGSAGKFMGAALRGQLVDAKGKGVVRGIGKKTQEDIVKVLN